MKRVACRLFYLCVLSAPLCACIPVPRIDPPPSIAGLDQSLKRVASGDAAAQTELARNFSLAGIVGGLGKDEQAAQRLLYAAADRGDADAQRLLAGDRIQSASPASPNKMMESAYWSYRLALGGNRVYMQRLAELYAQPDFPAYNLIESCKWRLLARGACDPKTYSAEVFQQASQRAQPLFQQFP